MLYIIYKLSAVNFLNILRQKQISIRFVYFALHKFEFLTNQKFEIAVCSFVIFVT